MRRPGRQVEHAEHPPQAGDGGLRLVEHLGELGDRLEEPVREEHEADHRPGRQPARRTAGDADEDDARHGEHGEQLARREQQRAEDAGAHLRPGTLVDRLGGPRAVDVAGLVGPDRLRPGDDLGDRRHHLAVALPRLLVRAHEVALDESEHERERGRDRERDDREHPVVGQHHAGDEQHQRPVEQPRQAAPREELGERLDVARDAGDERAAALLVVVGEAEAVDVPDQPGAQVEQRLLAAAAEPHDRLALGDARDDQGAGGDQRPAPRRSRPARRRRGRSPCRSPAAAGSARRRGRDAPTAASIQVTPSPWRRTGASSRPRPIVRTAENRPIGSLIAYPGCAPAPHRRPTRWRSPVAEPRAPRRSAPTMDVAPSRSVSNASTSSRYGGTARHQLEMRAVVDDGAAFEVDDVVGEGDRRRPGRHHQHGGAGEGATEVAEHDPLGLRVERRRRVVEQQQRRRADQRPGQGDALPLTAAQADPALADHGVESARRARRRIDRPGRAATPPTPRRRCSCRRATTFSRIVPENRNASWNTIDRDPGRVATSPESGPISPPVSSTRVLLPAPGRPDDGHDAPGRHGQVDVGERRLGLAGERERHVARAATPTPSRESATAADGVGLDRLVEHLADPFPSGQRVRHLREHVADQPQREHEQREQVDEARQLADADVAAAHSVGAGDDESDVRRATACTSRTDSNVPRSRIAFTRASRSRPAISDSRSVSRRSAPYALTSCTPSKLSWTPDDSLPELVLGGVEVLVDPTLVGDVRDASGSGTRRSRGRRGSRR